MLLALRDLRPALPGPVRRTTVRVLATLVAAVLATTLLPTTSASAKSVSFDKRLFGVHDGRLVSLTRPMTGSIRLWDMGVTWAEIERSPGVYDFARLDQIVRAAMARKVEVTLVLGITPGFYGASTNVNNDTVRAAYRAYVRAVMERYRNFEGKGRGIQYYQVWNEMNVVNFWTGNFTDMGKLSQIVTQVRNTVDGGAKVVGPAFVTRYTAQLKNLTRFYFARLDGTPVWKFMDVVSLNLYPMPKYSGRMGNPEDTMKLLAKAKASLAAGGVPASKPIWNTEINYGMQSGSRGGTGASTITDGRQAAYVIRTYLLNSARGIKRVFWYSYDMSYLPTGGTLGNTRLTSPANGSTLTTAGKAFYLVQRWMKGKLVGPTRSSQPCTVDRAGTYTCVVKYGQGVRRIYWNPTKSVKVRLVKSASFTQTVYGVRKSAKGGSVKTVDYRPLMVRSKV
jgi:hypothetical protein